MKYIKSFFTTDNHYKEMTSNYKKIDAYIALIFYMFFLLVYYFMGRIYAEKQIYLGTVINIMLAVICLIIIKFRKQKLDSLGLSRNNIKKSLILGTILGVILLLLNGILPNIIAGNTLVSVRQIAYNAIYYLIIISLVEELIFRGYIQTRIYGLIKRRLPAIIITAILFMIMHIPFQMGRSNMNLVEFIANNWLWFIILIVWHVVFDFLYRKYNNILTGTIFHGFMNFSNSLFK